MNITTRVHEVWGGVLTEVGAIDAVKRAIAGERARCAAIARRDIYLNEPDAGGMIASEIERGES
jgi:hypothetical protein